MNMKYILTVASAGLFLLSGCQKEKIRQDNAADGSLRISIISSGMNYGITTESETNIHTLDAYHFENGILSESFNSLQIDEKGVCRLDIKQKNGMLYFLFLIFIFYLARPFRAEVFSILTNFTYAREEMQWVLSLVKVLLLMTSC